MEKVDELKHDCYSLPVPLASNLGLLTTNSLRTLGAASALVKEGPISLLHFRLGFLAWLESSGDHESGHETEANGGDREYPTRCVDGTCALNESVSWYVSVPLEEY